MARNDVKVFDEALAKLHDGDWASTDHFYCAICDNTVAPAIDTGTPTLSDFTEVGSGGTYVAGGTDLGTLATLVAEAAGVMTFDSATNPTWAQNAGNDVDAYWGIVYNYTDAAHDALLFVDLGGPVDMTAGTLTITWNASGLYTITRA
ncbi:MAG: hypothetical protein EHM49_00690 [Deltaproteobacteria bacterium]|nr:MAG: hypothetical protein EHM49_00690 [Deltaproteobacteria bacterium]